MKRTLLSIAALCAIGAFPLAVSASVTLARPNLTALTQGLIGYWSLDGSTISWATGAVNDLSQNGNTGVLVGMSTTTSPLAGKVGGALAFNGTTSAVCASNSASLDITGALSISAWIYPTSFGGGSRGRIFDKDGSSTGYMFLLDNLNTTSSIGFGLNGAGTVGGASTNYVWAPANSITLNKWQFVTVTYDGSGTAFFYVNGMQRAADHALGVRPADSAAITACIGSSNATANRLFPGKIDDLRVYDRALSPQEAALLYATGTADLGHSPAPATSFSIASAGLSNGLVGYWPLDGDTTSWTTDTTQDMSGSGNSGKMVSMSTSTSPAAGKIGQALTFDGINDIVAMSGSSIPVNADFTISFWAKQPSIGSIVLGLGNAAVNNGWSIRMGFDATYLVTASAATLDYPNLSTGVWHHMVLERTGNTFQIYIDGAASVKSTLSGSLRGNANLLLGAGPGRTGTAPYYEDSYAKGQIDDVRIYDRALSPQEISQLYSLGSVAVAHSNTSAAAGINSGLAGYWTFDGPSINWATGVVKDMSGKGDNGQMVGLSTSSSPTAGKIGQALKFGGDYIDMGNASALNPGTGDFTLAVWADSPTSFASNEDIVDKGTSCYELGYALRTYVQGTPVINAVIEDGSSNRYVPELAASNDNKWHFYVMIRKYNNYIALYKDGILQGSASTVGWDPNLNGTDHFRVGAESGCSGGTGEYYPGKVDDVRFYTRALSLQEIAQLYSMGR